MKGLLLKDWYVAVRNCRFHIGLVVGMSLLSLVTDTGMLYLLYPMLFAGMIPVYVLSVDEKWEWGRYAQTLPVTRRAVVTSKYIGVLITVGGTALLMTMLWFGRLLIGGGIGMSALLRSMCVLFCFGLLFPALMLPAMLRLGVEKGRIVSIAVMILAVALVMGAFFYVDDSVTENAKNIYVMNIVGRTGWLGPALLTGTLILFVLSWLLAARLYEKREL